VTGWSLLLASGLDGWWSGRLDDLSWQASGAPAASARSGELARAGYGWLIDGRPDAAPMAAAELAATGVTVRVAREPFNLGGRDWPRGSLLLRNDENPALELDRLRAVTSRRGLRAVPTATARVEGGPDLGGDRFPQVRAPRIAMLAGPAIDPYSVGAAWHLFDVEAGIRVSLVDTARIGSVGLERYNVLVIPDVRGGAARLGGALGDGGREAIDDWIRAGGTLIGVGGATELIATEASKLSAVRLRRDELERYPPPLFGLARDVARALAPLSGQGLRADGGHVATVASPDGTALGIPGAGAPVLGPGTWALLDLPRSARERSFVAAAAPEEADDDDWRRLDERLRRFMPSGAILAVELDPEHWLAWGQGGRVPVLARGRRALLAADPVRVGGRFMPVPSIHLGGLLWPEAAGRLAHTAYVTREGHGRGQVILFAFDPNFRGYFWGAQRLFLNAALLGPGLGATHSPPW